MRVIARPNRSAEFETSPKAEFFLLNDSDLLEAWNRDGHRAALGVLVQRYSAMVLSVCRRRCRSHADADDAFQSTFLYLARNSNKIRHPERLVGWLHRVAQRAAVATLPSSKRESAEMDETPGPHDDPLDRLAQRHEAIVLDEEIADLPEHYRSAIVMHLLEGRSIESLAKSLETTPGSVRGRLQRGKQLLAQRLRRRGIVPILAFAAAQSWTVNAASAAEASQKLLDQLDNTSHLPDPPIDTSLLDSLLTNGVRLMPSLSTFAGVTCCTALIAFLMMSDGVGQDGGGREGQGDQVTFPASKSNSPHPLTEITTVPSPTETLAQMGMSGFAAPTVWAQRTAIPEAASDTAKRAQQSLESKVSFTVNGTVAELPRQLASVVDVPVLLDQRGLAFAKVDPSQSVSEMAVEDVTLRSALRMLLEPLGLKVVVEEEGLVITANPSALVHQGIGATRWITIDEDAEAAIASTLDSKVSVDFVELPISEVANLIQQQNDIPLSVDTNALEEIGISLDEPITFTAADQTLRSVLKRVLSPLDLTYTIIGESLVITTEESADQITRIYWLEGTGFAKGDFDSITNALQTTVAPDAWDQMGGSSTIVPLKANRPAIMVNTSYPVHETIDAFFKAMRETHFGAEPVLETFQQPAPPSTPSGLSGGGMEGFGGMMGGGGMF